MTVTHAVSGRTHARHHAHPSLLRCDRCVSLRREIAEVKSGIGSTRIFFTEVPSA